MTTATKDKPTPITDRIDAAKRADLQDLKSYPIQLADGVTPNEKRLAAIGEAADRRGWAEEMLVGYVDIIIYERNERERLENSQTKMAAWAAEGEQLAAERAALIARLVEIRGPFLDQEGRSTSPVQRGGRIAELTGLRAARQERLAQLKALRDCNPFLFSTDVNNALEPRHAVSPDEAVRDGPRSPQRARIRGPINMIAVAQHDMRTRAAWHEAGHLVVGHVLGCSPWKGSIVPERGILGKAVWACVDDDGAIAMRIAGFMAESMALVLAAADRSRAEWTWKKLTTS